jgi:hypothetical protein
MDWEAKESLFVALLDRLDRPTLGQYAMERRNFQKRPAVCYFFVMAYFHFSLPFI